MRTLTLIRDAHDPYINILLYPANPLCPLRFTCSGWNSERRHNCDLPRTWAAVHPQHFSGMTEPRGRYSPCFMYLLKHARLYGVPSLTRACVPFCIANHDALLHVGRMPPNPYVEVQFPLGGPCYHAATRGAFFMNKSWVSEMLMAETFADDISVCRPDIVENMLVRRSKPRTATDGNNHLNIIPFNF